MSTAEIAKALGKVLPRQLYDDQLGARVRRLRRDIGLRQRELAFPGCGGTVIGEIERGRHTPPLEPVLKLCLMLDVNPRYLCWGRGPKKLTPERQRYILEFIGGSERELWTLLSRRRKT